MPNYYKKTKAQIYLEDYQKEQKYTEELFIFKNYYIPFIKDYLKIIIEKNMPNNNDTTIITQKFIHDYFLIEPSKEIPLGQHLISNNTFYLTNKHYPILKSLVLDFCKRYNLNGRFTLKNLLDAYYMELQRIDYLLEIITNYPNYYQNYNNKRNINEKILLNNAKFLFDNLFLNTYIPLIIKNNPDKNRLTTIIKINTSLQGIIDNTLYISPEIANYFIHLLKEFMFKNNLGNITESKAGEYKIDLYNLDSLIEAHEAYFKDIPNNNPILSKK